MIEQRAHAVWRGGLKNGEGEGPLPWRMGGSLLSQVWTSNAEWSPRSKRIMSRDSTKARL